MAKKKRKNVVVPKPVRRSLPTANLYKIDCGDGVFIFTNTRGVPVTLQYDKGDGVVRQISLTT